MTPSYHNDLKGTSFKFGAHTYKGCPACLMERHNNRVAWTFWLYYRDFGWAFSGGWAEQPAWMVFVIRLFSREYNLVIEEAKEK